MVDWSWTIVIGAGARAVVTACPCPCPCRALVYVCAFLMCRCNAPHSLSFCCHTVCCGARFVCGCLSCCDLFFAPPPSGPSDRLLPVVLVWRLKYSLYKAYTYVHILELRQPLLASLPPCSPARFVVSIFVSLAYFSHIVLLWCNVGSVNNHRMIPFPRCFLFSSPTLVACCCVLERWGVFLRAAK